MSVYGIQGQLLEITVVGCNKLKDTEWISRQDPYVCLEYASSKHRTRTCTDGGKAPTFQEKFVFTLIEGLPEIKVSVWNSNTLTTDVFIGTGKVQLQGVLSQGYDDSAWPLQDRKGRHAGEVRLIMHYANAKKPTTCYPPPYAATAPYPAQPYVATPSYPPPPPANYPTQVPAPYPSYSPNPGGYPPSQYQQSPTPYHPAYPAPSSYPQRPAYPPLPPSPQHYNYPQGTYPPPTYPPPPY